MPVSFDSFTKNYNELVNEAIHGTGYDAESLVSTNSKIYQTFFHIYLKINLIYWTSGAVWETFTNM
jgi:hypothetical protein